MKKLLLIIIVLCVFLLASCRISEDANTAPSEPVARRKRATHAGEVSHRKRTSEPLPNNAR